MGTPNKLEIVLGLAKFNVSELSFSEWMGLIDAVLHALEPELKYLLGEVLLKTGLEESQTDVLSKVIESQIISWPERLEIGPYTKVFKLMEFYAHEKPKRNTERGIEWRVIEYQLYLCRKARLLMIRTHFKCTEKPRAGMLLGFTSKVASKCEVFQPSEQQLESFFEKNNYLGLAILRKLNDILKNTIQKKEERLRGQKEKQTWLSGIIARLNL